MMRIVDIIYTVPDILLIVLLSFALKAPLQSLTTIAGFGWVRTVGENLISIFIVSSNTICQQMFSNNFSIAHAQGSCRCHIFTLL